MAVEGGRIHHLDLQRVGRIAVALLPQDPAIHLRGDMAEGRDLAHFVKVFLRCVVAGDRGVRVEGHRHVSVPLPMPQCGINCAADARDKAGRATKQNRKIPVREILCRGDCRVGDDLRGCGTALAQKVGDRRCVEVDNVAARLGQRKPIALAGQQAAVR